MISFAVRDAQIPQSGGRVELSVSKRDSDSPVITRTIGDPSTGTHVVPASARSQDNRPERPPLEEASSAETARPHYVDRPTYVELPPPRTFNMDTMPTASSSSNSTSASPSAAFGMAASRSSPTSPAFDPGLEVLVVDDDPLTRMLMKRLLSRLGCNVSTAENGEIALDMILGPGASAFTPSTDNSANAGPILERSGSSRSDESRYHIIFLDNQMPVLSGLKAIERLRRFGRGDFVVGVTG